VMLLLLPVPLLAFLSRLTLSVWFGQVDFWPILTILVVPDGTTGTFFRNTSLATDRVLVSDAVVALRPSSCGFVPPDSVCVVRPGRFLVDFGRFWRVD
jgi:hypothetical protein